MVHNNPMKVGSLTDSAPQHAQVQTQNSSHALEIRLGEAKLGEARPTCQSPFLEVDASSRSRAKGRHALQVEGRGSRYSVDRAASLPLTPQAPPVPKPVRVQMP